jgi:hypothetical protein
MRNSPMGYLAATATTAGAAAVAALTPGSVFSAVAPEPVLWAVVLLNAVALKAGLFALRGGSRGARPLLRLANGLLTVLALACLVLVFHRLFELGRGFLAGVPQVLANPVPANAMEGRETVKAWLLAQGANIYPSMESHPFIVTIYPPLYHAAIAMAAGLEGWTLAAGRLVSLASFLGMGALMGWSALRLTGSWLAGLCVAAMLLFDPVLAGWSLHARPDMLAWLLALGGVVTFQAALGNSGDRARSRLSAVAGALFCLALFTKQQTLPFALGAAVWAVGKGKDGWRAGAVMAACAAGLGLVLAGGLELASSGGFLRDTVLYPRLMGALPSVTTTENLLVRLGQVWEGYRPLWMLLAAYLTWCAWRRRWDLPLVLAVVNAAFMGKLLASWGADINYAFGLVLSALMAAGLMLGALIRTRPYGRALGFVFLLAWLPRDAAHPVIAPADVSFLQGLQGEILANTEGGHLFLGRPGTTFFDGIETQLYEDSGLWRSDGSALVEDVRSRRFTHLVLYGDFSPQAFRDAVALYYEPEARHGQYAVFGPGRAALTAELGPSGAWRAHGAWRVEQADISSLHRETEGLAPTDRSRPGYARLKLSSREPMSRVEARFTVRLDPKDPKAAARWTLTGAQGRELAFGAARESRTDVLVEAREAGDAGREVELTVELDGNAWLEPVHGAVAVVRGQP